MVLSLAPSHPAPRTLLLRERRGQRLLGHRGKALLQPRQPLSPALELGDRVAHHRQPAPHPCERLGHAAQVAGAEEVVGAGEER